MGGTSTRHPEAGADSMIAGQTCCRRERGFYPRGSGQAPAVSPSHFVPQAGAGPSEAAGQALTRIKRQFSSAEMPKTAVVTPKDPTSYEQALSELDRLVQQMEGGQLPLDQLLDGYRRGAELLAYCRNRLQAVEDQVKVLEEGALKAWQPT